MEGRGVGSPRQGKTMTNDLRIILVQSGARRDYELAYMFEQAGVLEAFHTTSAWHGDRHELITRLLEPLGTKIRNSMSRRRLSGFPPEKLHASFAADLARQFGDRVFGAKQRAKNLQNRMLGRQVMKEGFGRANVYFTVDGNGGFEAIEQARKAGLKIASDVVITPLSERIAAEEAGRWPDWPAHAHDQRQIELVEEHYQRLIKLCDVLVCPSQTVADGLITLDPAARDKVAFVPYGLSGYSIARGHPMPGRVLFAGGGAIRKGLPYLGMAATLLRNAGDGIEIVVAGGFEADIRKQPECRDLQFLGHLPRSAMKAEFVRADLFCLPSLAEGSAGVCLEALANGIPCVVTRAAGSPVEDGKDGLIVPERDPNALAQSILSLVRDRDTRNRMGRAALEKARGHELECIAPRLIATIRTLLATDVRASRAVAS